MGAQPKIVEMTNAEIEALAVRIGEAIVRLGVGLDAGQVIFAAVRGLAAVIDIGSAPGRSADNIARAARAMATLAPIYEQRGRGALH